MVRHQPPAIYEGLHGSSASDVHVRSVLQLSTEDKGPIKSHIEGKLEAKGIQAGQLLGSTAAKVKATEIIKELKTEAIYHGVFNKALVLGEPIKDVNRAIHQLICITQHARNKIKKTREARERRAAATLRQQYTQGGQPSSFVKQSALKVQSGSNPLSTSPEPSSKVKQKSSASPSPSERVILLYSEGEASSDAFMLRDTVSAESAAASNNTDFQFSVFKERVETRLAPRVLDWSNLTAEYNGHHIKCDAQGAFEVICALRLEDQPHIILKGLRVLMPLSTSETGLNKTVVDRNRESSLTLLSERNQNPSASKHQEIKHGKEKHTMDNRNVFSPLNDPAMNNRKRKNSINQADHLILSGQEQGTDSSTQKKLKTNKDKVTDQAAVRKDHATQRPQSRQAGADEDAIAQNLRVEEEDKEKDEEPNPEESDTNDDEAASLLRAEQDKQFQVKPTKLPTWEESGQDIQTGRIVRQLCYDEDDPLLAGSPTDQALENDETQLEDENCIAQSVEMDPAFLAEEERHRKSAEAKKELQRILEQKDDTRMKMAYQFFKHDENKNSISIKDRIVQDGALRPYQQHQADAMFFMMWVERYGTPAQDLVPLRGGILGDEPGFGKSATMAGVFLCEAWNNLAWSEVDEARTKEQYDKHLAKGTKNKPQPADAVCPSGEKWGICCPCVDRNPSSRMSPRKGVGLLMVPANLAINSLREWYNQINTDNPHIQMRLLYQGTLPKLKKDQYIAIGPDNKITPIQDFVATKKEIKFLQDNPNSPLLSQYVILCSRDSWKARVKDQGLASIRYGRYFRDEFHQEPNGDTQWIQNLKSLNQFKEEEWDRPYGWLVSGTPIEKGPESLIGVMGLLMHGYDWTEHAFWKNYTPEKLQTLQSDLQAVVRASDAAEETSEVAEVNNQKMRDWNMLLQNVMIQRGRGCLWNGKPVITLPRVQYREHEVYNTHQMQFMAAQVYSDLSDKAISKIKTMTQLLRSSLYGLTRACATFPALGQTKYRASKVLINKDEKVINLTRVQEVAGAGLFKEKNMSDPKKNPLLADLDTIISHSPKIDIITHIINRRGVDYRGDPAQIIFFTYHNLTAIILFLWFTTRLNYRVAILHAQLSGPERDSITRQFQAGKLDFIVTTARVGGTGITLTKAMRIVMVEAPSDSGLHDQCQARAHRFGNLNWKGLTVHEIYNLHSPAEMLAKRRREGRVKLAAAAAALALKDIHDRMRNVSSDSVEKEL